MTSLWRNWTFAAAVVVSAVAVFLGPYWLLGNLAIAFSSLLVVQYCLRKAEFPKWLQTRSPVVRSRVEHYAKITLEGRQRNLKKLASNPFEAEVLSAPVTSATSDETRPGQQQTPSSSP